MMSVIRIHRCEYPRAIGCLLLWRYTSSSCRWRLIDIIFRQLDDTSWTYTLYTQLRHYCLMELVVQQLPDRAHLIICWFLFWLIDNHQIWLGYFNIFSYWLN
jgi:hypothetical protein